MLPRLKQEQLFAFLHRDIRYVALSQADGEGRRRSAASRTALPAAACVSAAEHTAASRANRIRSTSQHPTVN